MSTYIKHETAWCPGCGNFMILDTLKSVLEDLELPNDQVLLAAGIGQAAKTPQYLNANSFCGLHGRSLPAAQAAKMANDDLTIIIDTGDGDSYGEGGNHFLHAIRRNVDITHFVHDNRIYGLTKGQISPTTDACTEHSVNKVCNLNTPFNPLAIALTAGATFVARSFSGNKEHLAEMMKRAIHHQGYALLDILQPCVSFNKVNTFKYYKEHVDILDENHPTDDRMAALELALTNSERIPIGVFYENNHPAFAETHSVLSAGPALVDRETNLEGIAALMNAFV